MAKEIEEVQLWQTVAPVEFSPIDLPRNAAQSLLIKTRQGPGYQIAGGQLGHALKSRATHALIDFSQNACVVRYQIDGNWEQLPPLDRETGDAMLYALKQLCQLNPTDRRSAQSGKLGLKVKKDKYTLTLQSQGVATGERVLCRFEAEKIPFERLSDLGMREKMIESFKAALNASGNVVVMTAPKGEGLTTSWQVGVNAADRFVRDFQSIEDKAKAELEIINVNPNFFGGDTDRKELDCVKSVFRKEPDVILYPELPGEESLKFTMGQVKAHDRQVYLRMNGTSSLATVLSLLNRYDSLANDLIETLSGVLSQKLVRRLCDNCKLGFEPPPALLKQLGIPAGRVAMLYQPFIPPPIEEQVDENGKPAPITPCYVCNGRGYFGRIAIFEFLQPGEKLKAALAKTRDVARLGQIAKDEGHRGIQAEAILTVARGLTSLDELKRVFAKK